MSGERPSVSVVIPTYNRGPLLGRTLRALARVEYPDMQVVVVDDGSAEEHAQTVRELVEEPFRLLSQANAGPAAARNRGVAATESEFVAFLDDDCAPLPDWLERLVAAFADDDEGRLGGVGGRVESEPPHNFVSRFCAAARYSTGIQPEFTNVATANACYRRSVLEEVGGFDERFLHPGGDDPDLSRRVSAAGYDLRFVPDAVVHHAEIDDLRELVRHLYWRGLGEGRDKRKNGRSGWVLLRTLLFPAYCARRGVQTWRVSAGSGSVASRATYAVLESAIGVAFIAGSVIGLWRR